MAVMGCRRCGTHFAVGLPFCPQCTHDAAYLVGSEEDPNVAKITSEGVTDAAAYADVEGDIDPVEATAAAAREAAGVVVDEGPGESAGGEGSEETPEANPPRQAASAAKKATTAKKAPAAKKTG